MTKLRTYLAGLAFAGMASAAYADFSYTPTVVSDYDFRGTTQTANDPAFQLELDYSNGPLHLGVWTSNVAFDYNDTGFKFYGARSQEIDYLADYSGGDDKTVKYTFGLAEYTYPGFAEDDFLEIFGTLVKGWASATLHYSPGFFGYGGSNPLVPGASAYYIEGNFNWPVGDSGFGIVAHLGHSWGDYWDNYNPGAYEDYAVGVTKGFGHFSAALKYIDTSGYYDTGGLDKKPYKGAPNEDVFSGKGRAVLSITTTLPWAKE